jgi:hypothetical protein
MNSQLLIAPRSIDQYFISWRGFRWPTRQWNLGLTSTGREATGEGAVHVARVLVGRTDMNVGGVVSSPRTAPTAPHADADNAAAASISKFGPIEPNL